jgi:hypothetical protein
MEILRAGGFIQVKLDTGEDLANLDQLDQKLWVALACPTAGLEFDTRTLQFVDTDNDGRVRASEVIAAAKWAIGLLKNPDDLVKPLATLPLAAINDTTPEGAAILASARQTLIHLGKGDASAIALEDITDTVKIFAATNFNGDGLIPVDAGGDDATKAVITDILTICGAETDRSGKPGISQPKADQFFAEALAYSDWWKKAESDPQILPLGTDTAAAVAAWHAVRAKVDDYFARCRLAAFDPRALTALNHQEIDYVALCLKDLSANASEMAGFPLAQVVAGKPLPLAVEVNPAWTAPLAAFQSAVVKPVLGDHASLTEADWLAIGAKFAAYEAWYAAKLGAGVEPLGLARVREILATPAQTTITDLILKDKSLEPQATLIATVERLVRYYLHLHKLCLNFVNFKNFYNRIHPAIFQAGTLYLDQRSCDLCLTVEDPAKHALMAGLAGAFLVYCDCVRKSTGEKLSIVAVVSQGNDDNLMTGRNGLFYDRKGRDFDATVTKIITNPISLRQAFWSPYKKFGRFVEQQVAQRAAAAQTNVTTQLTTAATTVPPATPAATTGSTGTPGKLKFDPSVVALICVAVGSLGVALASVLGFFDKFDRWEIPLVIAGLLLLVSGPSLIIAFLNLRKRNLGPILDANGWAVNAAAKINVPLGTSLTSIAKLPPGSTVDTAGDKFAQNAARWPKFLVAAFLMWWIWTFVDETGTLYWLSNGKYGHMTQDQKERLEMKKGQGKNDGNSSVTATNITVISVTTTNAPAQK